MRSDRLRRQASKPGRGFRGKARIKLRISGTSFWSNQYEFFERKIREYPRESAAGFWISR
jgi:hypothetical protein